MQSCLILFLKCRGFCAIECISKCSEASHLLSIQPVKKNEWPPHCALFQRDLWQNSNSIIALFENLGMSEPNYYLKTGQHRTLSITLGRHLCIVLHSFTHTKESNWKRGAWQICTTLQMFSALHNHSKEFQKCSHSTHPPYIHMLVKFNHPCTSVSVY